MSNKHIGTSFDDFLKRDGIYEEVVSGARKKLKETKDLMEKLEAVILQARSEKIRLLIEVELSGKLYVYCDSHEKRNVMKMMRKNRIINRKVFFAGDYNIRFLEPHASYQFLGYNKGKIVHRLYRNRTLEMNYTFDNKVYFFDIPP